MRTVLDRWGMVCVTLGVARALGSVSVRGWLRVVVMAGFGPVSWLVGVGDRCHRRVDPVGVARRFWSGLELYLVAPPGTWFEEQGFCRV
jgi:hypothetical protein